MSPVHTPSSFSTSPFSSSTGGTHQNNNGGPPQSAFHHPPPHVSGSYIIPDASGGNLRDSGNTSSVKRVGNVEGSGTNINLNATLPQITRAIPRGGPPFKETPQYFLNVCHFLTVVNAWDEACDNSSSVPEPTNEFQCGLETIPQNNASVVLNDPSIVPEVTEALMKMHSERQSSTSYPQDYGLPPSAFMKQSANVPGSAPVSDIVISDSINTVIANPIVVNERFTPPESLHTVVEDDSVTTMNTTTDNYIPHSDTWNAVNVDTSWEDGHYSPSLYHYVNNVTLPTQTIFPAQIPQGHPDPTQRNPQPIPLPVAQPYYTQPYPNTMTMTHPPSAIIPPFPPQLLPAMTSLHRGTPSEPSSSSQKRKRETDAANPTRPRKRRAVIPTTSTTPPRPSSGLPPPERWDALLASLPRDDPRKKGPPHKIEQGEKTDDNKKAYDKYTCLYRGPGPKEGGDVCTKEITTNCIRNWLRHVGTHAADEEDMLEEGTLQPEGVHALLWVEKNSFTCSVRGCGFLVQAWRVDGIKKTHMKNYHGVDVQRRKGSKGRKPGKAKAKTKTKKTRRKMAAASSLEVI